MSIDVLKDQLPDYARDLKLNLSSLGVRAAPHARSRRAGSFIAAALASPTMRRPREPWSTPSAASSTPRR